MTVAWIAAEKAEFPITRRCRTLHISPSGFYASRARPESTHARDDRRLRVLVRASFAESKQRYGSPRVHEDLLEQHEHVSRKRVVRLMQEAGLQARLRKRYKVTTMSDHDQPVAANLLDRDFTAAAPNQRWVGDTTEFVIGGSGKLYLAATLDLFSRFIVGWAVSASNDRQVTIKALQMALKRRCPDAGLVHHSDQGCTYASEDYQDVLDTHGITCSRQCEQRPPGDHQGAPDGAEAPLPRRRPSAPLRSGLHLCERGLSRRARHARYYVHMSRRGNCYDNAVMESFFSTVKSERREHFESNGEAKMEVFDYIEVFSNQRRRHSTLGQISPAAFERCAAA